MLPDDYDEEDPYGASFESHSQWPRAAGDPSDEFQSSLALIKKDIDAALDDFPMILPTKNAAIKLAKKLKTTHDMIERFEKIEVNAARRKILENFRKVTMGAAIAATFLTHDGRSIDEVNDIFSHLHQFQSELDAILQASRRRTQ